MHAAASSYDNSDIIHTKVSDLSVSSIEIRTMGILWLRHDVETCVKMYSRDIDQEVFKQFEPYKQNPRVLRA